MDIETFSAAGEAETAAIAVRLAPRLQPGDLVTLEGDLGAGKTVFARALIRALAGDGALEVPSPTFTLAQTYETPAGTVWHFDLYRITDPGEIYELGWEEALANGIVLVEWPQKLGALRPARGYRIGIVTAGAATRTISIASP